MRWYKRHPSRLAHERKVLEDLIREEWVKRVVWSFDEADGEASVDIDFEAGGKLRESRLIFPFVYPAVPPRLIPREPGQRWSTHQWGTDELCLEIRADNWQKEFDAAGILRSARKLLDTEGTIAADGQAGVVPVDHRFTEGQALRWQYARLVMSKELVAEVKRRGIGTWGLDIYFSVFEQSCVCFAVGLSGSPKYSTWTDPTVPEEFASKAVLGGRIAYVDKDDPRFLALTSSDMKSADRWAAFSDIPYDGSGIAVGLMDGLVVAKFFGANGIEDIINIPMDNQQRSPDKNAVLAGKRVAILGCGSMGSKVAATLARAGVGKFYLVDADLLKVGNLARHELDWAAVGAHKVDGLIQHLKRLNPQVSVERWINHLRSQTSTANLVGCLAELKNCDLIVETTGSGQGFVYASSVAEDESVPMVWGRVFGGGFGGYIARSRSGIDLPPLEVRAAIYNWFNTPGFPKAPPDAGIDYGLDADEQAPLIADDSDVTIISGHVARMALDTLRSSTDSDYAYSVYVIGLRKEWLFKEAFETYPLDVPVGQPGQAGDLALNDRPVV